MGAVVESPAGTLIKKRPSAETAYWCLLLLLAPPPTMRVRNSAAGGAASKDVPEAETVAAIICPSGAMKNNSLPSCLHRGEMPPPVEICHLPHDPDSSKSPTTLPGTTGRPC